MFPFPRVCDVIYDPPVKWSTLLRWDGTTQKSFHPFPQQHYLPSLRLSWVNFTNILRAAFSYESFVRSFLYLHFRFELFLAQVYWGKCAHKLLVKLTPSRLKTRMSKTIFDFLLRNPVKLWAEFCYFFFICLDENHSSW